MWSFFRPGASVSHFLSHPISTIVPVALAFNQTTPLSFLSSIFAITKAIQRMIQLVQACVASRNIHISKKDFQIRQNSKKSVRVGGPQSLFAICSFILFFLLRLFFLKTKLRPKFTLGGLCKNAGERVKGVGSKQLHGQQCVSSVWV